MKSVHGVIPGTNEHLSTRLQKEIIQEPTITVQMTFEGTNNTNAQLSDKGKNEEPIKDGQGLVTKVELGKN